MTTRIFSLFLLVALADCGLPANVVVLVPDENGTIGKVAVHKGGNTTELDRPFAAVNAGSETSVREVFTAKRADVESAFAGALAAAPRAPVVYILYFRSESAEVDAKSRGDLLAAEATARKLSDIDVSVVGHADATGSDAYNEALSLHRAETVRDALVAAGIPAGVIEIAYYGASDPLVPAPRGVHEPRNRRVEITIR
jgi:outer membrane protein OmpA-like peptidoglycan-associated protein